MWIYLFWNTILLRIADNELLLGKVVGGLGWVGWGRSRVGRFGGPGWPRVGVGWVVRGRYRVGRLGGAGWVARGRYRVGGLGEV